MLLYLRIVSCRKQQLFSSACSPSSSGRWSAVLWCIGLSFHHNFLLTLRWINPIKNYMRGAALFLRSDCTSAAAHGGALLAADFSGKCLCCHPALAAGRLLLPSELWLLCWDEQGRQSCSQTQGQLQELSGLVFSVQKPKWCLKGGHVRSCSMIWSI